MKVYHPVLDRTVEVNARQAKVLAASGWVDPAEHTEPDEESEDIGLAFAWQPTEEG